MKQQDESVAWIKMPTAHLMDERVEHLFDEEGAVGFGVYMMLLLELYRQRSHKASLKKILSRKYKGCTKRHLQHIIEDYDLFCIDENGFVASAIDYCVGHSKTRKKVSAKKSSDDNQIAIGCESDDASTCARIKTQTQTQSSSSYRRRNNASEDATADNTVDKTVSAKPSPVLSVDEIISQMHKPSAWSEAIIMNSGFSRLLLSQWDRALQWFRLHITERSKEGDLPTLDHARRYFADLIHHPTTAALLQTYLKEAEQTDNPYHFEDPGSKPGHRSYLGGCTIPDDAPPRPNNRAEWVINRWETF